MQTTMDADTNSENASSYNASSDDVLTVEQRYNKLKGLAVKLKKKVSELSEQNKYLESENKRLNNESEEMQNKIQWMSETVKKIQAIQMQYDQSQDDIEQIKNENKRLVKKLENIVLENDNLRDALKKEKQNIDEQMEKMSTLTEEKKKLQKLYEQSDKQLKDLINELKAESLIRQQKSKEVEDLKNALEAEVKAHKLSQVKLGDMKHECTSNSVLSLEVANYEKSIDTIKAKLDSETNQRIKLEATINEHEETIKVLTSRISELQDSSMAKSNRITSLEEKNLSLEEDVRIFKIEVGKIQNMNENLTRDVRRLQTCNKDLESKANLLNSEILKLEEENKSRIKTYQSHVDDLKREINRLNSLLENSKHEISTLQEEFEGYKLRAQSVLLKTKYISSNEKHYEEEIENLKHENELLREKLEGYKEKTESLSRDIILLKDEKLRATSLEEELVNKLTIMRQDYSNLLERNKSQENEMRKLQLNHEKQLNSLRKEYEEKQRNLQSKYEDEISQINKEISVLSEVPATNAVDNNTSVVAGPTASPPLVEREECEGSESVETCQNVGKTTEQNSAKSGISHRLNATLTPLDQLLDCSFGDDESVISQPSDNPAISAYKSRIKHLTELLADAEKDIDKLTQLNLILKEDIRRQKRYVKREEEAVNFEYLKNIVFKFITLENRDERSRLVPVLDTVLKLTPEENQKLNELVATTGVGSKISWIPGISGWNVN